MSKLKIAIQKSGRLSEKSLELLKECGIKFPNGGGKLIAESKNFPIEVLFLRDDDVTKYVEQKVADIGIVGENVYLEANLPVNVLEYLGFGSCRLSLAVPKDIDYPGIAYFEGKKIATSYPYVLEQYLKEKEVNASIEFISGSVEIAPSIGLANGVCDIVSSGSTLMSNGLKEVEKVLDSQAVLISNQNLDSEKLQLLNKLLFRIQSVLNAKGSKYILLNAPNNKLEQIINVLPVIKSPTVLPLANSEWSSLHAVIQEDQFWQIIDQLKTLGAEGILVLPIEKILY